jgi:YidC/Oxa1 family membrane protein insertase
MQEKRALLAIVLIFLVYIVFTTVFRPGARSPSQSEDTRTGEAAEQVAPAPAGEAGVEGAGVDRAPAADAEPGAIEPGAGSAQASSASLSTIAPAEEMPLTESEVSTPLYTCRFTSMGGLLKSFVLHEYPMNDSGHVELVPESEVLPFGVALLLRTGERIDLSQVNWSVSTEVLRLEESSDASLAFELITQGGLVVRKTCRFKGDTYVMDVDVSVSGPGSEAVRAVEFGWQSGLRVTEIHREKDDLSNFAGLTLTGDDIEKVDRGDVKKRERIEFAGEIRWSGVKTKYFLAAVLPQDGGQVVTGFFSPGEEAIGLAVETPGVGTHRYLVYAGPLDHGRLKSLGYGLEQAVDFGWWWIRPLSKVMFRFILFCRKYIPNYGLVIIIMSLLIKILFYPLTQKSMKSMRDMQKLQPKMKELRETHKGDAQKLNAEMMKLYKEHGVNPLGGCFPMLLQMPVFIALFQVLSRTIELRQAPFMLWIQDLSSPDVIAHLPFSLPLIGNNLSLLPILMGVAMFVQQKMQSTDPKQAAMTYMMPVVFTVLFFRFPSGLVLYWLVNNILTIGHQYLMVRADRAKEVPATGGI